MGSAGVSSVSFDDPTGTLGHSGDAILGLKQFVVNETACPAVGGTSVAPTFGRRLFTGYIGDRKYYRGRPGQSPSLITGPARIIDITLTDVNAFIDFRVYTPAMTGANRPAETDVARIAFFLGYEFLSDTLFDLGLVNTSGPVNLDAVDYRGQRPSNWANDAAQASGKNWFIYYSEFDGHLGLFYDLPTSTAYPADLQLTNVLSEVNGTTIFAVEGPLDQGDAVLTRDPSRVSSGVYLPFTGGAVYDSTVATSYVYGWRDAIAPSANVKTAAKANALATRYLADNNTEDDLITCTVQLPASKVTGIKAGQLVQAHFSHLPGYESGAFPMRVLRRTVRQDKETNAYYWVDLNLSPNPPAHGVMVGILAGRDNSSMSKPVLAGGLSTDDAGWTNLGGGSSGGAANSWMSIKNPAVGEPSSFRWWGNPTPATNLAVHAIEVTGGNGTWGTPIVETFADDHITDTFVNVVCASQGIIVVGKAIWNFDTGAATISKPAGFVTLFEGRDLTQAPGNPAIPDRESPYVTWGYLPVAAGTYTVTFTRSNTAGGWYSVGTAVWVATTSLSPIVQRLDAAGRSVQWVDCNWPSAP